jgi:hypothetical protein
LASLEPARGDLETLAAAAALTVEHHRLERLGSVERAKSARANCRCCHEPIEKGGWRVALQPIEEGRVGAWGFVHLRCVGAYVGIKPELERLIRYSELTTDDVAEIATTVSALPTPDPLPIPDPTSTAPMGATPQNELDATE